MDIGRENEIADLAEFIAEEHIKNNIVDVEKIADYKQITYNYGRYEDYFDGRLEHDKGKFHIYINLDKVTSRNSRRARFTFGHELGHYFLDTHRHELESGRSLSFHPSDKYYSFSPFEVEANFFSSNLLMPKTRFVNSFHPHQPGFEAIIHLSKNFRTSIESTANQYLKLNANPCLLIKWRPDKTFQYFRVNAALRTKTSLNGNISIKFDINYIWPAMDETDFCIDGVFDAATYLSRWVSNIQPRSSLDLIGIEQTMKLGQHGWLTFMYFH